MRAHIVSAFVLAASAAALGGAVVSGQQSQKPPVFRSATDLVRVDVIVRDKNGVAVRGLKADDFVVQEDGKPQQITSFGFEEIATDALPPDSPAPALLGIE